MKEKLECKWIKTNEEECVGVLGLCTIERKCMGKINEA